MAVCGGDYEASLELNNDAAKIGVLIKSEATHNPVRHIALVPSTDKALNDGAAHRKTGEAFTGARISEFNHLSYTFH